MKKYSLILSALFLVACTTTKTATPAQTVQVMEQPTYTAEQLNHGKELYTQHCASCHKLKKPTSESPKEWKEIVPEMIAKANKKQPNKIDANTEKVILDYLVAMSTSDSK